MSTAVSTCCCEMITESVVQCPEHFKLWRYGKRLASVSSIVRQYFPLDPRIPPDVMENARDRGSGVDWLFAQYVRGELDCIPAGTRKDAIALFEKARKWFDGECFGTVEVQVLLDAGDYGGIVDFRFDGVPYDLKATYSIDHTARLQVAAYCDLAGSLIGRIIHVTERYGSAAVMDLLPSDHQDWRVLRDAWRVVQRRTA